MTDLIERRAAIRDILYRRLPQEIDADICRAIADELLALDQSQSERHAFECHLVRNTEVRASSLTKEGK